MHQLAATHTKKNKNTYTIAAILSTCRVGSANACTVNKVTLGHESSGWGRSRVHAKWNTKKYKSVKNVNELLRFYKVVNP